MKKKLIMSMLVVGLMFSMAACSSSSDSSTEETTEETAEEETAEEESTEEAAEEEEAVEEEAGLTGTYTGTGSGFGGDITVTLTLEDGVITECSIDGPDETETVGGAALEELAEQVIAANGSEIDGVSGATYTSDGVSEAVANALGE